MSTLQPKNKCLKKRKKKVPAAAMLISDETVSEL